jgi:protein-arginine kinase activator protein McsA
VAAGTHAGTNVQRRLMALHQALEVFVRHDCYRYADEVRAHIKTLVRKIANVHT